MQLCNILTFIVIGLFSLVFIIKIERYRSYSLNLIHWFFFLIFFFFIPLIQYIQDQFPLWLTSKEAVWILFTNLLIIAWIGFYALGYYIRSLRSDKPSLHLENLKIEKRGVFVSISLSIMVLIVFLFKFGFKNLLIRGNFREILYTIHPHYMMIIVDNFLKFIPVISLMGLLVLKEKWNSRKQWWFLTGLLIFINLLVNNPLASSRYWAGIVILGFVLFLFFRKKRTIGLVFLILLIGILIIYPLSNELRNKTLESITEFKMYNLTDTYTSPNFDAYEMGVHTVQYVSKNGLTYGGQLLGPLLFWIPRTLWEGKPVGSGGVVAQYFSFPYTNLSCPLPFEGYINFGVIGLVVFAFGLGWLLSTLDEQYWDRFESVSPCILSVYYPFLLGFIFFLMRGDLMSGFSYTIMFIVAGLPLLIK